MFRTVTRKPMAPPALLVMSMNDYSSTPADYRGIGEDGIGEDGIARVLKNTTTGTVAVPVIVVPFPVGIGLQRSNRIIRETVATV